MKFYHGSNIKFDRFEANIEFMASEDNFMQEGPGIYLTSSEKDASRYGKFIYEVEWKPKKLLSTKKQKISPFILAKIAKASPDWKLAVSNWDEEPEEGLQIAVGSIIESFDNPKDYFEQIWFDFYKNYSIEYISNMVKLGYDGFTVQKQPGNFNLFDEPVTHAIVFNVATLQIINVKLLEYLKRKNSSTSIKEAIRLIEKITRKKVTFNV